MHTEFEVVELCVVYLPCVRVSMRMVQKDVGTQVNYVNDGIDSETCAFAVRAPNKTQIE